MDSEEPLNWVCDVEPIELIEMIEPSELSPLNWACDFTLENYFFQIQTNSREGSITWSEAGQQTNEAKEVYCVKKYIFYFI